MVDELEGLRAEGKRLPFTVDAHLLAELGERLVGKPAIALGELVKNAYDADATKVRIRMTDDAIQVIDNGHGMMYRDIIDGFLRVGTPRKERAKFSPERGRRLTGSKGVGRLAAQMLGRRLVLETKSSLDQDAPLLRVTINWDEGEAGEELTEFTALVETSVEPQLLKTKHGTVIELGALTRSWDGAEIESLAREVWTLRSPFPPQEGGRDPFAIEFDSEDQSFVAAFENILEGWINLYESRIVGTLHSGHVEYPGGHPKDVWRHAHVHIDMHMEDAEESLRSQVFPATSNSLTYAEFEIRVFDLRGRQPHGLSVGDVREYLNRQGGVYLYDEGFRLPYYGPDSDWLHIEMDHAHRISRSKLLPHDLQVPGGQTYLPTTSRLFGVVNVSTSREREAVARGAITEPESLQIQVSRDRLLETRAFSTLRDAARMAIDLYANEKARRLVRQADERREKSEAAVAPLDVLKGVRDEMPKDTYQVLKDALGAYEERIDAREEVFARRASLLGTLATAGMSALALEHEQGRLLGRFDDLATRIESADGEGLSNLADELRSYRERIDELRAPFVSVGEESNRERARLKAKRVLKEVIASLTVALAGVNVDLEVDSELRFPKASFAELSALFQNALVNAANATLGERDPKIRVLGGKASRRRRQVTVLDNGVGVDLADAEALFEPFVRRLEIPTDRRALGLGGMGLGLTIIRTIAESLDCEVAFSDPPRGWSTALTVAWTD